MKKGDYMNNWELSIEIAASYKILSSIRDIIRKYFKMEKLCPRDKVQLLSVIDELTTNIVEHAYKGLNVMEENFIILSLKKEINDILYISVKDEGKGFTPGSKSKDEGGMGLNIVKAIVDDFKMNTGKNGTEIIVSKKIMKEDVLND